MSDDGTRLSLRKSKGVGRYQHSVDIELNSKHSLRLYGGRQADPQAKESWARHEVIGLVKYAPAVMQLYKSAAADNPYAIERLVELEKLFEEAEGYIKLESSSLLEKITSAPGNISIVKSESPHKFSPAYGGNPYANKGALLLAQFDELMVLLETCRAFALVGRKKSNELSFHAARQVKRIYLQPGQHKKSFVTREDIIKKTEAGLAAIELYGREPLKGVMDGSIEPEFAPANSEREEIDTDKWEFYQEIDKL